MNTIILTGGGTAGHVTPNLALIDKFQSEGWHTIYVGSVDGIEKELIAKKNIPYYAIQSGKLRRYFSWQNFLDPFKIMLGIAQAWWLCRRLKPQVIFSKGGFVAFPTVLAAWLNQIPVIVHESDFSPGLANRLSFPFAKKVCVTFADAKKFFRHQEKVVVTGTPIRNELLNGNAAEGKKMCGFENNKPIILAFGGSQGAQPINQSVRQALGELTKQFNIIHICGKDKVDPALQTVAGYKQFEYGNLPPLMAAADLVISRAGANSIYEILALKKLHILIPLPLKTSRGDQIQNAKYFSNLGLSYVIDEEKLNSQTLLQAIAEVEANKLTTQRKLNNYAVKSGTDDIYNLLCEVAK